jgi:hypothetical protein
LSSGNVLDASKETQAVSAVSKKLTGTEIPYGSIKKLDRTMLPP